MRDIVVTWITSFAFFVFNYNIAASTEINKPDIRIGVVSDSYYVPSHAKQSRDSDLSISVLWEIENSTEAYHIIETAKDLEKYGADMIIFILRNTIIELKHITLGVTVPTISVGRLYRADVPNDICESHKAPVSYTQQTIDYFIPEQTRGYMIKKTIVSVIARIGWTTTVIIYDNSTALLVETLLQPLAQSGVVSLRYNFDKMNSEKAIDDVLDTLYEELHLDGLNITVICELTCIKTILYRANLYDSSKDNKRKTAMHQISKWFIFSVLKHDIHDIKWKTFHLDNVALMDYECSVPPDVQTTITELIKNLRLKLDSLLCDQMVAKNITSSDDLHTQLNDALQEMDGTIEEYAQQIVSHMQSLLWHSDGRAFSKVGRVNIQGEVMINSDVFPNAHYGFNGRKFVVTTLAWPPFVKTTEKNGTKMYSGFCIDMLEDLATTLNFTYEFTEPQDQEWGRLRSNNTWTGMIGQLQNETVDLMVAPNSIQASREIVMDFTYPFYFDTIAFLVKRPDPNKNKWRTLVDPLSWQVLVCVAAVLPVSAMVLFLVEKHSPYFEFSNEKPHDFLNAFWYLLGALLTQGGQKAPSSHSARTVISFWWIFSIIMVATYSGNLIAFLTVTKEKLPFNTFDELADHKGYKWGLCGGSYIETFVQRSPLQTLKKLWNGIQKELPNDPSILDFDPQLHIQKVLDEDYVYVCDKTLFEVTTSENCNFVIGQEEIPNLNYGIGLPNNSPYTRIFSTKVLELLESGLVQIWREKHWPKQNFCKGILTTEAKKISMIDVQSAFYLIGIGIVLAVLSLFFECILSVATCAVCAPYNKAQAIRSVRNVQRPSREDSLFEVRKYSSEDLDVHY